MKFRYKYPKLIVYYINTIKTEKDKRVLSKSGFLKPQGFWYLLTSCPSQFRFKYWKVVGFLQFCFSDFIAKTDGE